jgi:acyl transferase domain-containing protein
MDEPIAVIGYSYRAPGCGGKGLFDYLAEAKSAFSKVPLTRFRQEAYYHPDQDKPGFFSSKGGHFLPGDIYEFDAAFFNLKADEARGTDPQHRLMLECAFEAAESAGLTLPKLAGSRTGVFAAIDPNEFTQHLVEDLTMVDKFSAIGTAPCMFANRLSYFFDLQGPSIAVRSCSETFSSAKTCADAPIDRCCLRKQYLRDPLGLPELAPRRV